MDSSRFIQIPISEHEPFNFDNSGQWTELFDILNSDSYNPTSPKPLLGVDWGNRAHTCILGNYFIGAQWIVPGKSAIIVSPKIKGLDYVSMFIKCLENRDPELRSRLSDIYSIDFSQPAIPVNADVFQFTPLLVVHFLILLERLTQKGLKSNFIQREEDMKAKVKGKILLGRTIKHSIAIGRSDEISCRHQDYSIDCPENRILKKALQFAQRYIQHHTLNIEGIDHVSIVHKCQACFAEVSEDIPAQIIQFRINPLFRDYADALKVAKLLLRRFDYSIDTTRESNIDHSTPPFWINMPILFELYILGELRAKYGKDISYHMSTYGNELDFVRKSEKLIIDAKYIDDWKKEKVHAFIRQLSGYARNRRIRTKIGLAPGDETTILNCMIVYPSTGGADKFSDGSLCEDPAVPIEGYIKFYELGVKLPTKGHK